MLTLAIDTADARGSLALLRDSHVLKVVRHDSPENYSSWLLPAIQELASSGASLRDVELYAVAGGPGSFTGLRVGLTAVKAWSEVHNRPIASVSRLEAMATEVEGSPPWIAVYADAHRGQVFGALYRRQRSGLALVGEEMVISPQGFLSWVEEHAGKSAENATAWASLDPEIMRQQPAWPEEAEVQPIDPVLAPAIGRLGLRMAQQGRATDALHLDANYVRRSDAEILWKGSPAHAK